MLQHEEKFSLNPVRRAFPGVSVWMEIILKPRSILFPKTLVYVQTDLVLARNDHKSVFSLQILPPYLNPLSDCRRRRTDKVMKE